MRHAFLDKYSRLNSVLHRRDPRVKILVFFAFILCVVLTPPAHIRAFFLYFLLLLCLTVLSRIPGRFVLKRSLELMPVVLCISLFVPFGKPGVVIFSVDTWFNRLAVTHTGLLLLWNVLIKAYLSILCSILLTNTTDFVDLLKALERLRLPRILIMILSFMYRYLFVIEDELEKMQFARSSRSVRLHGWSQVRALANMAGVLFLRSYEKAEAVYLAMCCRGYTGQIHTLHNLQLDKGDLYFVSCMFIALTIICMSGV